MAVIVSKTHQMLKAVEHSKLATEFSPEFVPAWVNLIQYTLDIGEVEEAAKIADIAKKFPAMPITLKSTPTECVMIIIVKMLRRK